VHARAQRRAQLQHRVHPAGHSWGLERARSKQHAQVCWDAVHTRSTRHERARALRDGPVAQLHALNELCGVCRGCSGARACARARVCV
jgi:hypothetical protein